MDWEEEHRKKTTIFYIHAQFLLQLLPESHNSHFFSCLIPNPKRGTKHKHEKAVLKKKSSGREAVSIYAGESDYLIGDRCGGKLEGNVRRTRSKANRNEHGPRITK